jgi:hypothetical protein
MAKLLHRRRKDRQCFLGWRLGKKLLFFVNGILSKNSQDGRFWSRV